MAFIDLKKLSDMGLAPWEYHLNKKAAVDDIDLIALRDYLQEMKLWKDTITIDHCFQRPVRDQFARRVTPDREQG